MNAGADFPSCRHARSRFKRLLEFLGLRSCEHVCGDFPLEDPPDAFVREPRRPSPMAPGGTIALDLPDVKQ
jgi:hypothetical protein